MSTHENSTLKYYDTHAQAFDKAKDGLNLEDLYSRFLANIPENGEILDLGCGTGRDAAAFIKKGYNATAVDSSEGMLKVASEKVPESCLVKCSYDEVNFLNHFDGLWACASLLHVSNRNLLSILKKVIDSLKPGGIFYCSFKEGSDECRQGDRFFNNQTLTSLSNTLSNVESLDINEIWQSSVYVEKVKVEWVNAIGTRI